MTVFDEEWYKVNEVADILKVSSETVRDWLKNGSLPGFKMGRQWRVSKDVLETFVKEFYGA